MAFVRLDPSNDAWLNEHEACERLLREIANTLDARCGHSKNSLDYASLSTNIRRRLQQFEEKSTLLKYKLDDYTSLTNAERERRLRLVDDLKSKEQQLTTRFNDRTGQDERVADGGTAGWLDDPSPDTPLLADVDLSVDQLRQQQSSILSRQDQGLDRLASVISRQKHIAVTIGTEVESQNSLIDEVTERVERTDGGLRREIDHIKIISRKDSTCGYWIIIIILFLANVALFLF